MKDQNRFCFEKFSFDSLQTISIILQITKTSSIVMKIDAVLANVAIRTGLSKLNKHKIYSDNVSKKLFSGILMQISL